MKGVRLSALRLVEVLALVVISISIAHPSYAVDAPPTLGTIQINGPCAGSGGYAVFDDYEFEGCYSGDFSGFGGSQGTGFIGGGGGGGSTSVSNNTPTLHSPNNQTATTDKKKDKPGCLGHVGDPVEVKDGAKLLRIPLFQMPGEMGLKYVLYYQSVTGSSIWNYNPWRTSLNYDLDLYCGFTNPNVQCSKVTLYRPDGSSVSFSGNHASYGNFPEIGGGGLGTLVHNSNGTWTLHDEDSTVQTYDQYGYLTSIKDVSGIGWTISSTTTSTDVVSPDTTVPPCSEAVGVGASTTCPNPPPPPSNTTTTVITHTDGQSFTIVEVVKNAGTSYASGSVTVTDPAGNKYNYSLGFYEVPDGGGLWAEDVTSLTFPGSPTTTMTFSYTGANQLLSSVAYNGTAYWSTSYNSDNEVSDDGAADGTERTSILYSTTSNGMVATLTNPLGMTTTNTYAADSQGNYLLASVSNSAVQGCGSTTNSMAWDGNDNLAKTVDNDGIAHTYDYAANGQLQTETEATGTAVARTIDYSWDPDAQLNRLLSVAIPGESQISYSYNTQNRLASVTRVNLSSVGTANESLTTTYAYTLYGNGMVETLAVTAPSPNGANVTTYGYDSHGNLTSVTDGLGHATTYSNYNGLGEVGKVVGPNGDETDYSYDARGRVASKTTHPNGGTATSTYVYDGFGKLAKITSPDGEVITWTRDAEMRVTSISHNDKDGTSTETFGYDDAGNVTSDVIARGSDVGKATTYVYNALGKVYQVKGAHGQELTYAYDGNGNVLTVTDALGHVTTYAYDALNRVEGTMDAASGVTSYSYDAGDHVTSVIDPRGLETTYSYDGLGQLWKQVSPDTGTTSFTYDAYGRLAGKTRASGNHIAYAYDVLNRLTSAAGTNTLGTVTRNFTWDSCTNGIGRLCSAVHVNDDTVSYSYSPEGWITQRAFSFVSGISYSLGYSYDNIGHVASVTYPDGNQALYYYTDGAVADVRLKIGTASPYAATSISYRPMDLAMSGWTSSNGLANTIGYDSDQRPTGILVPEVENLVFTYDANNRITHIANGIEGTMTQSLAYDAMNRLTTLASTADNESYSYDADGNRTQQVVNGATVSYVYPATSNLLVQTTGAWNTTWGYDADGNSTTANNTTVYVYSGFGVLAGANDHGYAVGAEGQRLRNTYTAAKTQTYFAPDQSGVPLAEDQAGTWLDYVYLNGRLVTVVKSGQVYAAHADQTGRPLALTNSAQAVVWESEDLPYPTSNQDTGNTFGAFNLGYPGQYNDGTGLWHNGNRDYSPYYGRYVESDPIGLAGGINTYAYVGNNPISNVDPLGLCDQQKCTQAAAVVAALGRALSSTGSGLTWTGIGLVGVSVVGGIFAPEGAELEIEGGVDGVSLITAGTRLSALGGVLTGYARNGVVGGLESGAASFVLGKLNEGIAGLSLPVGTSEATTKAVTGVLDQASEAIQAEAAACVVQ